MSTIFPGSASVGQVYNNYTFDGTAWNINGIDLTENYLEESSASAIYLTKVSASNTYLTQTSASSTYATKTELNNIDLSSASAAAVAAIVDSAPSTLNTLNELAAALGDDANYASTITTALGNKLNISTASSTYLTQASASATYLTQSSASTTYAPIVPTTQTGFRNVLINGGFSIDQRNNGNSQNINTSSRIYGVDRWYGYITGGFPVAMQRVAGTAPNQHHLRITGDSDFNNTAFIVGQRIEASNSIYLAGKTATLSVSLASNVLTSITWTAYYANTTDTFGTIGAFTRTQIATGTFNINSTLSSYSANISIPDAATTGIEITFQGGNLVGSKTVTLAAAQLELGSIATPFEQRPIGTELALCQRYYWRWNALGNQYSYYSMCLMRNASNYTLGTGLKHPVTMRAIPTLSFNSMFAEVPSGGGKALTNGVISNNFSTVENVGFIALADSNWGASEPGFVRAYNTTAAYVEHNAEL